MTTVTGQWLPECAMHCRSLYGHCKGSDWAEQSREHTESHPNRPTIISTSSRNVKSIISDRGDGGGGDRRRLHSSSSSNVAPINFPKSAARKMVVRCAGASASQPGSSPSSQSSGP